MNDKLLHFICGLGIALATGLALYHLVGCYANVSKGSALLITWAIAAGKESFDLYKAWKSGAVINMKTLPKIWNFFDFGASVIGSFAAVFILIVGFGIN